MLQVGAIYLWSYVYNIVRISSRNSSKEVDVIGSSSKSSRESSGRHSQGDSEPLLSNGLPTSEDHPEELILPSIRFDHKPQVTF